MKNLRLLPVHLSPFLQFLLFLCVSLSNICVPPNPPPPDWGPERVLPRHPAGDGPRHPVLLGRSHGDDGPQADRQAAFQRGATDRDDRARRRHAAKFWWPPALFCCRFICTPWWETPTEGRWANPWATSSTPWTSLPASPWRWGIITLWCMRGCMRACVDACVRCLSSLPPDASFTRTPCAHRSREAHILM